MMCCDTYRATVLEAVSDQAARLRLAEALAHIESCPDCQAAFQDFDELADHLKPEAPMAEPSAAWNEFLQQMQSVAVAASMPPASMPPASMKKGHSPGQPAVSSPILLRFGWAVFPAATAIAGILAAAGFWLGQRSVSSPLPAQGASQAASQAASIASRALSDGLDPVQVAHYTTAFARVSDVFDRRAGWMLVSDSAGTDSSSDMGLSIKPFKSNRDVVVLRLNMLRTGDSVSNVDLVIVPGEAADLTVQLSPEQSVHYRVGTSAGDEASMRLLAEIKTPTAGVPLATLSTTLEMNRDGQVSVGELQTSAGRYELRGAFSRALLPVDR